jgi:hypothetical protein
LPSIRAVLCEPLALHRVRPSTELLRSDRIVELGLVDRAVERNRFFCGNTEPWRNSGRISGRTRA